MKRLTLIIIGVLLCTPLYSDMNTYIAGVPVSGGTDSYAFLYTGDYASDTDKAYTSGGSGTIDGTWNGTSASDSQNHTSGGTYSFYGDANNEHLRWTITSDDILNDQEGNAELWVYLTGHSASIPLWLVTTNSTANSNNFIYAYVDTSQHVVFYHEGNNTTVGVTSTNTVSENTWVRICFRWSVTNNLISVKIGDNAWENDADADAVTAFAVEQPDLILGERFFVDVWGNGSYYDDFKIYTDYDADRP